MDWMVLERYLQLLLQGTMRTIYLAVVVLVLSTALALPLALMGISRIRVLRLVIAIYSWASRGTPELIILFLAFFGLSQMGLWLEPMQAAILAFTIFCTGYTLEIFRGGFQGVGRGQYEAARALGLPYLRTIWRIISPQVVRIIAPPYATNMTFILKRTSLASMIAVIELTGMSNRLVFATLRPFEFLGLAGLIYVILNSGLLAMESVLTRWSRFEI